MPIVDVAGSAMTLQTQTWSGRCMQMHACAHDLRTDDLRTAQGTCAERSLLNGSTGKTPPMVQKSKVKKSKLARQRWKRRREHCLSFSPVFRLLPKTTTPSIIIIREWCLRNALRVLPILFSALLLLCVVLVIVVFLFKNRER